MNALTKIVFVGNLGGTPACVNRQTGIMYIDRNWWKRLPFEHRLFILLHEYAHAVLNTRSEFEADKLAYKLYLNMGYSITKGIQSLTRVLSYEGDLGHEHECRTLALIEQARVFDKKKRRFSGAWVDKFYGIK